MHSLNVGSVGLSSAPLALPRMNGTLSPLKPYFVRSSRVSSSTRSTNSGSSTRSHLFRNTTSSGTPICRARRMCSLLCGIGPSTANIPNDEKGFLAIFSAGYFPDAQIVLEWVREEGGGVNDGG